MQLSPKAAVLCEVTSNAGHWAIQGHSVPLIWASIESRYTTSC